MRIGRFEIDDHDEWILQGYSDAAFFGNLWSLFLLLLCEQVYFLELKRELLYNSNRGLFNLANSNMPV